MKNNRARNHLVVILVMWVSFVLVSCSFLGLATPQSFNQKLLYSYGSVTSIRLAAKDLLDNGKISNREAIDVQEKANSVRTLLDMARYSSRVGDIPTAEGKLRDAQTILNILNEFLKSREGRTGS